ncbi:hypothetical protein C8F04DRAFT_1075286 [Mycena alexandri]|uniref:F-box domain-containing protein n=1 Tax=Mycena alexandri TaxID=1745969 RepID=A0AAD6TCL3_9AGAR|nr:hypothetical protein C8F04DRAFT_1075286 [Mycena alexandri]
MSLTLLALPPELRALIFDFCFPPPCTYVQIIPYQTSLPACRLNLPLALYSICKAISSELKPLPDKLRRLDFTYIIRGAALCGSWRPEYGSKHDDDPAHFAFVMRFAERVRIVGTSVSLPMGHGLSSASRKSSVGRKLVLGSQCAVKVLEVQPRAWRRQYLAGVMLWRMGELTTHSDVAERLEIRLIRDTDDPLETFAEVKARARHYQKLKEEIGGGPISVTLTALEEAEKVVKTNIRSIETWLKKFQETTDMTHRRDITGPLGFGGYHDEDDEDLM